jgi:cellulose synthase/poly-beta-1,6-N-acetylglucosamine synthase-like glycosyltransferase
MVALYLFWLSVFILVYTYAGFTLLLIVWAQLFPKPYTSHSTYPSTSMIIAAYNEQDGIQQKLDNILSLDYPQDKLEVILASDGSDDLTNSIVSEYTGDTVKLLALPRGGKHVALNAAVEIATGEILVFSDANSIYEKDALQQLTSPFADPKVGGVAGNQRYLKNNQSAGNAGEHGYWSFDRFLKRMESASGNVISATGAIYAIRRSLYQPVLGGVTDDFYISTNVIVEGYRLVFAADAVAYEPPAKSQKNEYGRKVRIMTRGLNAVIQRRTLLNPFKYGFYSLQLFTHKILRRLLYLPLIVVFLTNILLVSRGWFYQLTMLGQLAFYGMALAGWFLEQRGQRMPKLLAIPTYICMVYWAAAHATWNVLRGHRIERWSTVREEVA